MSTQKSICQLEDGPDTVYCWHEHCATAATQPRPVSIPPLSKYSTLPSRPQPRQSSSSTRMAPEQMLSISKSIAAENTAPAIETDTSKMLPKSPESSARASYVSSMTPTSPMGTPYSEVSGLETKSTEEVATAADTTSSRMPLSLPNEVLENIEYRRWQEFPPPPELNMVENEMAPELVKILKQSVVDQCQAARASEDQRRASNSSGLSRSKTSSGQSTMSPMLANEEELERDQPGLQVVPESQPVVETHSPEHHKFRLIHRKSVGNMSSKSSNTSGGNTSGRPGSIRSTASSKPENKTVVPIGPMGFMQYTPSTTTQERWVPPKPVSPWAEKFKKRKEKNKQSECIVCMADLKNKDLVDLDCKHKYCKPCFTRFITTTMMDESSFPPKCCLQLVPHKIIQAHLDSDQKAMFQQKQKEFDMPASDRVYCPSPSCSRWIDTTKTSRAAKITCPHCKTNVCSYCRGEAHSEWEACPQDYALDAALQEAARNGWQRCYACRTMVELSVGCRHITCKCGAEFCYVCGAQWQTCNCTETDQARRQQEILDRRNVEDVEAAEMEAAIRAVAQAQEAEAAELVRQAEARQAEEARMVEVYRQETEAKFEKLRAEMLAIHNRHRSEMDKRHDQEQKLMRETNALAESEYTKAIDSAKDMITKEHQAKANALGNAHAQALQDMDNRHQVEEDDTFLEISMHLRGKPNREARMKDMTEKLSKMQAEKREYLVHEQEIELQNLLRHENASVAAYQERLQSQERHRKQEAHKQTRWQTRHFWADGEWFTIVGAERMRLLEAEERRQLSLDIHAPKKLLSDESTFGRRPPHPLEIEGRMNNEWGVSY